MNNPARIRIDLEGRKWLNDGSDMFSNLNPEGGLTVARAQIC